MNNLRRRDVKNKTKKKSSNSKEPYFIKIRKKIYRYIYTKYANPYIPKSLSKQEDDTENEKLSTYYDLFKINKLINNFKCRLFVNFIEINLFDNPNETLIQFYDRLLGALLIKYNIYNSCYFYPNYFPLDDDIKNQLFYYINKIKKINKKNINQALGIFNEEDNIKKDNKIGFSNILNSMISKESSSETKSYLLDNKNNENNTVIKKVKKNSINEIEDFILKLTDFEIEKEKNDRIKKEKELIRRREEEENLRNKFKQTQKDIKDLKYDKGLTQKNINSLLLHQFRRNSARKQVLEQKKKNSITELRSKFKNTIDFIGGKIDREKKVLKKKNIIDQLIDVARSEKILHPINYYKKLKNGYIKNVPESMIGINDFIENDKIKYNLENTHSYLRKVSKNLDKDINKMTKSYTLKKYIKFPNIYLYGNMNRNTIDYGNSNTSYFHKNYLLDMKK